MKKSNCNAQELWTNGTLCANCGRVFSPGPGPGEGGLLFNNFKYWRVKDLAKITGWSTGHIYNLISRREENGIPFTKKGNTIFFIPNEVLEWLQEGNQK